MIKNFKEDISDLNKSRVFIELHTNDMKEPIKYFNKGKVLKLRIYYNDKTEKYYHIKLKDKHVKTGKLEIPQKRKPLNINVHANDEIRILWKLTNFNSVVDKLKKGYIESKIVNNTVVWNKKLEFVKKYINKNKQRPSTYDKDTNIKKMGSWIGTQQTNYAKNAYIMKDKEIQTKWEEFVKEYAEYFRSNEEEWIQRLESVKKYIDKNKHRPYQKDKDINVKKMGQWLHNQQTKYAKKDMIMKDKEIQTKWEEFVKEYVEYFRSNEDEWNQMLKSVKKYIDKNKQRPTNRSKNTNIKKMSAWINIQQTNYAKKTQIMKYKEIQTKWDGFVKEYVEYFRSNEDEWNQMLKSVKKYIDKNKQRPSTIDKDTNVKKMGQWISYQQTSYAKKTYIMKDKEIQTKWEGFMKEYVEYFRNNEKEWNQRLEFVKKYIDENKQRPSQTDKDTNVKKMGAWINTQQTNYAKKTNIMKDKEIQTKWESFITTYKEYFPNNIAIKIDPLDEKYGLQKIRPEQATFRNYLEHNKEHRCIICEEKQPFKYLETAHLKPRSICNDDELIDINIVQSMCSRCHKVYDLGDIGINNGKVEVHDDVHWVHTKTIGCYNGDTKEYFDYHFKNIAFKIKPSIVAKSDESDEDYYTKKRGPKDKKKETDDKTSSDMTTKKTTVKKVASTKTAKKTVAKKVASVKTQEKS